MHKPHFFTLFLPRALSEMCIGEVSATFPKESGGALMGRRTGANEIVVVDQVIGPGPNARHERYRFEPDIHWQHAQIADHYYATGGTSTYLGDWHSHPEATHGRLSSIDRKALRTIITEPEAQCPEPLMVIFWGRPEAWTVAAWQGRLRPKSFLWSSLEVVSLEVYN